MTTVRTFTDVAAFAAVVEPLLAADRVRSTVMTTVLAGQRRVPYGGPPIMVAAIDDRGGPEAAILQTPPYPLTVLAAPGTDRADWPELAAAAATAGAAPSIIGGPADSARAFADAWSAHTGARIAPHDTLLLYRLGTFVPPVGVPGLPRRLDADDEAEVDLVAGWLYEFGVFTGQVPAPDGPDPVAVRDRAARGVTTVLWTLDDRPVALAGHSPVLGGMSRIGPVFTPEALRGRRYGSAVTAAAVASARSAGATEVVLFTDASYPTSNAVYRRLGFVPVGEFVDLAVHRMAVQPRADEHSGAR